MICGKCNNLIVVVDKYGHKYTKCTIGKAITWDNNNKVFESVGYCKEGEKRNVFRL